MVIVAKWIVILFGLFIIYSGFIMLFAPLKALNTLRKAASTNFINYAEITIRMIPAIGLILYSDFSKCALLFKLLGGFMLLTSLVLYFVPRRIHHSYSMRCADLIKPLYFQFISILAFLFGGVLIYCVV
ncbi:hypothetical protein [Flavobacterium sp. K5-23]|uniref:hypothetical protein n=1 Tax=Flavobacterium sp. K5-23 TaxID=2746225 RepID=UPI0020102E3D|nr:hypothetical protein [Flavobacterium sp. K5-23]